MWLLLLLACGQHDGISAPADASCGTWASVGQPVLLGQCTACHASGRIGDQRHEAPDEVNLDSLAGAREWSEAIAAQVRAGTMPPGGGLSAEDAEDLLDWLDCGAPGEEATLPSGEAPEGLLAAAETRISAEAIDGLDGGIALYTDLSGGDLEGRVGPWGMERYQVVGERAWLLSSARYDADGEISQEESWDPPLLIWSAGATDWTMHSAATISTPEGDEAREEDWTAALSQPASSDPRLTDPEAPLLTLSLDDAPDAGPALVALRWRLSDTLSIPAQDLAWLDASGEVTTEARMQLTVAWAWDDLPAFPLETDVEWMGRLILEEGAP